MSTAAQATGPAAARARSPSHAPGLIRRNLAWAFGYNLAALPLAALGLLNPLVASAAMTLSSVLIVWNSLRLGRFRVRGEVRRSQAPSLQPAETV